MRHTFNLLSVQLFWTFFRLICEDRICIFHGHGRPELVHKAAYWSTCHYLTFALCSNYNLDTWYHCQTGIQSSCVDFWSIFMLIQTWLKAMEMVGWTHVDYHCQIGEKLNTACGRVLIQGLSLAWWGLCSGDSACILNAGPLLPQNEIWAFEVTNEITACKNRTCTEPLIVRLCL